MMAGIDERDLVDCSYGCGMLITFAPSARTGDPVVFNPELCELCPDVWVLRRGQGMVPCSGLSERQLAVLRSRGVKGWRRHRCREFDPGMRSFSLPSRLGF